MWQQKEISLSQLSRGFHIITDQVIKQIPEIINISKGLLHIFIRHTSASILIQENADPAVLADLATWLDRLVPENDPMYTHTEEGPDDMPAHIKGAITAVNLSVPIIEGQLALGVWQGIFLMGTSKTSKSANSYECKVNNIIILF